MALFPERCLQLAFLVRLDRKYRDTLVVGPSIRSRLAPKSFAGFLKAKQTFQQQKAQNDRVRFSSEYSTYDFESDEFSDKE